MANSHRLRILEYLRDTTMALIDTDDGYNYTVASRKRGMYPVDHFADSGYPAVLIVKADEQRQNITKVGFISHMNVMIQGIVKNSTGADNAQGDLDNLIEDIVKALEQDRTLGGNAKWLDVKSIQTNDDDLGPHAICGIIVDVAYDTLGVTP